MIEIKVPAKYNNNYWIFKDINVLKIFETIEEILDKSKISNNIIYNEEHIECWYKDSTSYTIKFLQDTREFVLQRENEPIICKTLGSILTLLQDMINEELDEMNTKYGSGDK